LVVASVQAAALALEELSAQAPVVSVLVLEAVQAPELAQA